MQDDQISREDVIAFYEVMESGVAVDNTNRLADALFDWTAASMESGQWQAPSDTELRRRVFRRILCSSVSVEERVYVFRTWAGLEGFMLTECPPGQERAWLKGQSEAMERWMTEDVKYPSRLPTFGPQ